MTDFFKHIDDASGVLILAFVGGFIDAAGYLEFQGVFTSSITGNLVVAAASVSSTRGVLIRSLVCASFTLASLLSTMLSIRLRVSHGITQRYLSIILLSVELLFMVAVAVFGYLFNDDIKNASSLDDPYVVLAACIMGASMGAQNVVVKETWSAFPATTVMTSTLVNFGSNTAYSICNFIMKKSAQSALQSVKQASEDGLPRTWSVRSLLPTVKLSEAQLDANIKEYDKKYKDFLNKTYLNAKPIVIFVMGAVAGAASINSFDFVSIAIPVGLIIFLQIEIFWKIKNAEAAALDKKVADDAAITTAKEEVTKKVAIDVAVKETPDTNSAESKSDASPGFGVAPSYRVTVE